MTSSDKVDYTAYTYGWKRQIPFGMSGKVMMMEFYGRFMATTILQKVVENAHVGKQDLDFFVAVTLCR